LSWQLSPNRPATTPTMWEVKCLFKAFLRAA
jgi:hypothetical protein